jgi:hypothetical protein
MRFYDTGNEPTKVGITTVQVPSKVNMLFASVPTNFFSVTAIRVLPDSCAASMHDIVVEDDQLVLQQATAAATAADGVRSNTPNESPKTVVLLESVATLFGFVN